MLIDLKTSMKILQRLQIILIIAIFCFKCIAQDNSDIMRYVNNKEWALAEKKAKSHGDIAILNLVLSQKFLDINHNNKFEDVIKFVKTNPDWPQIEKIKEAAESYLCSSTNKKLIVNWFTDNCPKTGNGYKFYALAASEVLKNDPNLKKIIQYGWIYGNFTKFEEHKYFKKFSKYLTIEDRIKRIDEHLWNSDINQAKNSMHLVPENYKKAFNVTISAIENKCCTDQLFKNLSKEYYTPSLLFHYLNYKKRSKALPNNQILSVLQQIKSDGKHSGSLCNIQIYWAREFLYVCKYNDSYKIISKHFALSQDDLREAEWHCGWIALSFLHKPKLAKKHFKNFLNIAKTPISLSRGNYWLGRSYSALGNLEKAKNYYTLASAYTHTFYGQIASIELKGNKMVHTSAVRYKKTIKNGVIVKAIKYLISSDNLELAKLYTKNSANRLTKDEIAYIVYAVAKTGNVHYTLEFAKLAAQNHVFIREYLFPTPYGKLDNTKETPAIYALIRQESAFNQFAISNKEAMGLMQLIKDTACRTAKSVNVKCSVSQLTKDPYYNIKLGTKYFKELLNERKGSYIVALASYNTSGKNVDKWIESFGDPREIKSLNKVIDWLELVPFYETRNFIQRVLENIQVYKSILNNNNSLNLKQYLL